MTTPQNITRIQDQILTFSPEALAQVEFGWREVEREFAASRDETTRRIGSVLQNNPLGLPEVEGIRFGTESGTTTYASLLYATPADAAAAFDSHMLHPYVYLRDGTVPGRILGKAAQALDPAAVGAQITGFGMGAIWAALSVLRSGDHLVASDKLFGTTKARLIDFPNSRGIDVTFVDGRDPTAWQAAIVPGKTKAFFYEPVANPTGEVTDTPMLAAIAHQHYILVIADSSATPLGEFLAQGADVVVPSLTKFVGLGDSSGGAVLVAQSALDILGRQRPEIDLTKHNPFLDAVSPNGWNQSPEVSFKQLGRIAIAPVRHRRQIDNARLLANWLNANYDIPVLSAALTHPENKPLHSQIFAIDFGDQAKASAFADSLGARVVNNFGGAVTSLTIPRSTTHKALSSKQLDAQGIGEGLVRISVGIEDVGYLKREFAAALKSAGVPRRRVAEQDPRYSALVIGG